MRDPALIVGPIRPNRPPLDDRPAQSTSVHLRHLAFHGNAEHVRAIFEAMPPAERARHADPDVLRQAAVGTLARAHRLPPGAADELRRERELLESIVQLFVSECCRRHVFPRDLFRTLLDWAEELLHASRLTDAVDACRLAMTLGVDAFPEVAPWIRLRLARAQMLLGELDAAQSTLLHMHRRLDRVADRDAIPAMLEALGTVSLQTRRAASFKRLLVERLRVFHTNVDERRAVVNLMRDANRGVGGLLTSRDLGAADKVLWLTHWALLGAARHAGWRPIGRLLEKCDNGSAYVRQYGTPAHVPAGSAAAPRIDATLVTRAMGGIGDLLMMTPGLHALQTMRRRNLVLAIPRRFFPLFDGNGDVELMDIDEDFDPGAYREWFNLTDCPAARIESRTAPAVRTNRITLFARGLGLTGRRLRTMDRRPRYVVSEPELNWRDRFFADRQIAGKFVVGVQPRTDESYRDVPHMPHIVEALTRHASVLVFGTLFPGDARHPDVIETGALDLRQAFALASGCDALVTPDSAFFHLAGALDLPCVGLFGPTDGRVRGQDYPRARVIDARRMLPCIPCWRNEVTPCGLTGLRPSACLGEIAPADVVRAVHEAAAGAALRLRAAG
jgi:glycosyl transferase family 9 (putative heptosyltransferase)